MPIDYRDDAQAFQQLANEGAGFEQALMEDDEALARAFRVGMPGFSGTVADLSGKQLVNLQMEASFRARPWVVTMLSMRNGGYPGGALGIVAGTPPDNQVSTSLFPPAGGVLPPERAAYNIGGIYLRVEWGVGNAREVAFVSYPFAGGTFQVNAASLRVEVPSGLSSVGAGVLLTAFPTIGAFASPLGRSQGATLPPQLVTNLRTLDDATPVRFFVPPRAVGYRLYTVNDLDATAPSPVVKAVQQKWLAGVMVDLCVDGTNVTAYREASNALEVSGGNAWQRATRGCLDYARLSPMAESLFISTTNVDPNVGSITVGVEWMLDLG